MNIKKTLLAFLLSFIIFIPLQVKGQDVKFELPRFLPDCDKTVYQVKQGGNVDCEIKDEEGKVVTKKACVYPDNYNEATHGKILGTYINRKCGFDDFVQLLANAFNFGLAILAIVATFFFIWGGFGFIIAGGRQEKIQEAKDTLKGTFFGILIVLSAWMLVNTYIMFTTGNMDSMILGKFWWGGGDCHKTINKVCDKNNLHEGCGGERGSTTDKYVRKLQTALNNVACGCGPVDGCFGPKTKKCVQSFQISNGIIEYDTVDFGVGIPVPMQKPGSEIGDGVVGENTWEYISQGKRCLETAFDPKKIGEGENCCLPTDSCGDCACYETSDETCGGLVAKGKYTVSDSYCSTHAECGFGCCVPDGADEDTLRNLDCYDSQNGKCEVGFSLDYTFVSRSCDNIQESCNWWICYRDTNDCVIQRVACPGGYEKKGSATGYLSKVNAETNLRSIDECNKGYCYKKYISGGREPYMCVYTSLSKCSSAGGNFVLGGKCLGMPCTIKDADNNDTGIKCESNWAI